MKNEHLVEAVLKRSAEMVFRPIVEPGRSYFWFEKPLTGAELRKLRKAGLKVEVSPPCTNIPFENASFFVE